MRENPHHGESAATHVYLIERANGGIKVGVSNNVRRRRAGLANGSPDRISIVTTVPAGPGLAFAIERGFKALMARCRLRGEWFDCGEFLAFVALYVVEHGDCVGAAVVWAALDEDMQECRGHDVDGRAHDALVIYAKTIFQRTPEIFKQSSCRSWRMMLDVPATSYACQPWQPLRSVSIYPEAWNVARLATNRATKEARRQARMGAKS